MAGEDLIESAIEALKRKATGLDFCDAVQLAAEIRRLAGEPVMPAMPSALDAHHVKIDVASRLLPAWFVPRTMDDTWFFGLILVTGQTLCISTIDKITMDVTGALWLDVDMLEKSQIGRAEVGWLFAPTSRTTASIRVDAVVAAFELSDT